MYIGVLLCNSLRYAAAEEQRILLLLLLRREHKIERVYGLDGEKMCVQGSERAFFIHSEDIHTYISEKEIEIFIPVVGLVQYTHLRTHTKDTYNKTT